MKSLCVWVCAGVCRCPTRPKALDSPERVVGAGNQIHVLCNSNKSSLPLFHLSLQPLSLIFRNICLGV